MRTIIVVEGNKDKQVIESFFHGEIITTNGSDIPRGTKNYLLQLSLLPETQIIILTDPDGPGIKIRSILNDLLPNAVNVHIQKDKAIKGKKIGVAETSVEDIKLALEKLVPNYQYTVNTDITTNILRKHNLTGSSKSSLLRKKLSEKLSIPESNAKSLCKILNSLAYTEDSLTTLLKEITNEL